MKLSNSQVRRSRMCLRLLQYEVVERRRRPFQRALAAAGLATHAAAAVNLRHRKEQGRYLTPKRIAQKASDEFDAQAYLVDWKAEEVRSGEVKDRTIGMSVAHAKIIANDIVPLEVELKVEEFVPEVGSVVVGVIDVVSRPVFLACSAGVWGETCAVGRDRQIRDLKTKDSCPPALLDDDADQLVIYQLVSKASGQPPADLFVDYVWMGRTGMVRPVEVPDEKERTRIVVEDLRSLQAVYDCGLFPRTGRGSWFCAKGKCDWFEECILGPSRVLDL